MTTTRPDALFTPSQTDVRRFFCGVWRKHLTHRLLEPLEVLALDWCLLHPEYQTQLASEEQAIGLQFKVESGNTNPFLHLSMHLAIAEQLAIDQPVGIRANFNDLAHHLNSQHEAAHRIMECLGETLWRAQREQKPPDSDAYLECIRRQLT
jgi:Domain of unknown function (DUF1841)